MQNLMKVHTAPFLSVCSKYRLTQNTGNGSKFRFMLALLQPAVMTFSFDKIKIAYYAVHISFDFS